jgi:hypothetical protein
MDETQAQMSTPPVGGQDAPVQPELTVTDLNNLRSIVDVAVRRGAFGAAEISGVGGVFDKLNTFLNAVAPPQPPAQTEKPTE